MASKTIDGGPAFPTDNHPLEKLHGGMSLRDWFAGQAVNGLYAGLPEDMGMTPDQAAQQAYEIADAMLKARQR